MSNRRAATLLLLLVVPVWTVGMYHSMKERKAQIRPRGDARWYERYAKLRPHLAGERQVALVHDPPDRSNRRLFQTQYVLAPVVVRVANKRAREIRRQKVPLIYDIQRQRVISEKLSRRAAKARRLGVAMETIEVSKGLALMIKREPMKGE